MVINDKKFASMLDKKVKHGYQLMVREDEVLISGAGWMLAGEMRELGRETLAVLVKHLGYIPRECCCVVFKAKDEYMQQGMTEAAFEMEKASFDTGDEMIDAVYTGLRMGWPLYQLPDNRILSVELASGIVDVDCHIGKATGEVSVCWMDDDSCIWFRAYRPGEADERKAKWDALETVRWTEKA